MLLYDAPAPNPYVIRLFTLERKGLTLDVQSIDIMAMENRKPTYRNQVNPRGELPALRISDTFVLTEITAICEYLDEVAIGGISLFGITPLQRAETRMWLRRMDLEIAQPVLDYYRNDPATIDFYKGNRIPTRLRRSTRRLRSTSFSIFWMTSLRARLGCVVKDFLLQTSTFTG
jgi:glutathione S-transferase